MSVNNNNILIMSACDIIGLSPTAFDHKQIIRYFYLTVRTPLIKSCL